MPQDEFDWIQKHIPASRFHAELVQGIGDDAAVYAPPSSYDQLYCVDTLVEHVHFKRETMSPSQIGYKALVVNISDIAAMGGIPLFYLVSIAIPSHWNDKELDLIYQGMKEAGEEWHLDMIGGDTVSSPNDLVISVTVGGKVEKERALLRTYARPGDYVFLTGPTGLSAAGLHVLLSRGRHTVDDKERILVDAHQKPKPHVNAGRIALQLHDRIALNDVSDGLASELWEIAEASNVSIHIHKDKVPVAKELNMFPEEKRWEWIFFGGEDFVLVGTIPPYAWERYRTLMKEAGLPLYHIGLVEEGEVTVKVSEKEKTTILPKDGYNHFK